MLFKLYLITCYSNNNMLSLFWLIILSIPMVWFCDWLAKQKYIVSVIIIYIRVSFQHAHCESFSFFSIKTCNQMKKNSFIQLSTCSKRPVFQAKSGSMRDKIRCTGRLINIYSGRYGQTTNWLSCKLRFWYDQVKLVVVMESHDDRLLSSNTICTKQYLTEKHNAKSLKLSNRDLFKLITTLARCEIKSSLLSVWHFYSMMTCSS